MPDRVLPPGPWTTEPDHGEWVDLETGYLCVFNRVGHSGHLCGYVAVPAGHPTYGLGYDDVYTEGEEYGPEVHGGLTYAASTAPGSEPDDHWWFGFDCAHAGDLTPMSISYGGDRQSDTYRNVDYVKAEAARLALALRSSWPRGHDVRLPAAGPERDRLVDAAAKAMHDDGYVEYTSMGDRRPTWEERVEHGRDTIRDNYRGQAEIAYDAVVAALTSGRKGESRG